ncbi:MAG: hypothetical protein DME03_03115 [Candidatus Rokuibacteriota bacterium]|nr:MAG: hypothetical protein DME03_03115 [Candidatus Rokubacteria bacterium]
MATSALGRPVSWRSVTSLLLAAAFVVLIAAQAPHLVHHFFETDHVQDECPFATNGERTGGLQIAPVAVVAVSDVSMPMLPAVSFEPGSVAHATPLGRAPPARPS